MQTKNLITNYRIGQVKSDIQQRNHLFMSGWRLTYNGGQRCGFTLIELLVVVLIIGILASIALPQYRKAVEKSRLSEARVTIAALEKAIDLYVLTNGYKTVNFLGFWYNAPKEELDIDVADCIGQGNQEVCSTKYFDVLAYCHTSGCGIRMSDKAGHYNLYRWLTNSHQWGSPHCDVGSYGDEMGNYICHSLEKEGWEYFEGR